MTKRKEQKLIINLTNGHTNDKEFILENIEKTTKILKFIDKSLFEDREFMKELITKNGFALQYMPEEFKDDKEIVLIALRESAGFALKYASKRLRADREVVYQAVKKYMRPLDYASQELQDEINKIQEEYYSKHKV